MNRRKDPPSSSLNSSLACWGERRRSGSYLLEFATILAAAVPLLLGALDVHKVLYGYGVVRHATEIGLRCLYPVQGECSTSSSRSTPRRLFDWYKVEHRTKEFVRRYRYTGTAYWRTAPTYTFNRYKVRVLDSVSFSVPTTNWSRRKVRYPASAQLRAVVERGGIPVVRGSDPSSPIFQPRDTSSTIYSVSALQSARAITAEVPEISIPLDPAKLSGALHLTAAENARCLRYSASGTPDLTSSCDNLDDSGVRMVLWIEGDIEGGQVEARNHINLSLTFGDGSSMDLGGQVVSNPGAGRTRSENFYPRGLLRRDTTSEFEKSIQFDGRTPNWFNVPIRIKPGQSARLKISRPTSERWDRDLSYNIRSVKIFMDQYFTQDIPARAEISLCSAAPQMLGAVTWTSSTTPITRFGPQGDIPTKLPQSDVRNALVVIPSSFTVDRTSPIEVGEIEQIGEFASLNDVLDATKDACEYTFTEGSKGLSRRTITMQCPHNFGASSRAEQLAACPPDLSRYPAAIDSVDAHTTTWKERTIEVGGSGPGWEFEWTPESCNDPLLLVPPSSLQGYRKIEPLTLGEGTRSKQSPISGDDEDPRLLNTQRGCETFSIESLSLDPHSALASPHFELVQSGEGCLRERVLKELVAQGAPHNAFLDIQSSFVDEIEVPEVRDPCVPTRVRRDEKESHLIARALPLGQTPPECVGDHRCEARLVSVTQSPPISSEPDAPYAAALTLEAIKTMYPQAKNSCTQRSAHCVTTNAAIRDKRGDVSAALDVPLLLLGNRTYRVAYSSSRVLERHRFEQ